MMADPPFPIKSEAQRLIDVQIETLRQPPLLTHRTSMNIACVPRKFSALQEQLDLIARKRFDSRPRTAAWTQIVFRGTGRCSERFR